MIDRDVLIKDLESCQSMARHLTNSLHDGDLEFAIEDIEYLNGKLYDIIMELKAGD